MHATCCPPRSGGVEELEVGHEDCFKRSVLMVKWAEAR